MWPFGKDRMPKAKPKPPTHGRTVAEQLHEMRETQREILALATLTHEHQHQLHTDLKNGVHRIMTKLDDLNAKVDELQTALDAEQAQIAASIQALTDQVAALQAIIDAGTAATDAQLQAVIDRVSATITDLQGTIPDA